MTNKEANKIRSAYANGFEYPFGNGSLENCGAIILLAFMGGNK